MAKGEHQVKTANNSFVDAEGSGTITFYVDRPNAKPVKIILQHVLYVPACGTNNLLSIIQLMRKGVNFDFKLDGATASPGSVLVYEAPLINSLFVLRPSTTSALVSKASVVVDDPPSSTPRSQRPIPSFGPRLMIRISLFGMLASAISPCQLSSGSRIQSEVSNCMLRAHRHALVRHASWARCSGSLSSLCCCCCFFILYALFTEYDRT